MTNAFSPPLAESGNLGWCNYMHDLHVETGKLGRRTLWNIPQNICVFLVNHVLTLETRIPSGVVSIFLSLLSILISLIGVTLFRQAAEIGKNITRPTLERRETLGRLRSKNPNMMNHFANQSHTCQLLKILKIIFFKHWKETVKSDAISSWTDKDQLQIWRSHSSRRNNHLNYLWHANKWLR